MEILEKRFFQRTISSPVHVRYMLNFEPDKKKCRNCSAKGPADSMGKFTIKVKNVNKYKEKEIDIGKSDKKQLNYCLKV